MYTKTLARPFDVDSRHLAWLVPVRIRLSFDKTGPKHASRDSLWPAKCNISRLSDEIFFKFTNLAGNNYCVPRYAAKTQCLSLRRSYQQLNWVTLWSHHRFTAGNASAPMHQSNIRLATDRHVAEGTGRKSKKLTTQDCSRRVACEKPEYRVREPRNQSLDHAVLLALEY